MEKDKQNLKDLASEALNDTSEPRAPKPSKIKVNSKLFFVGFFVGVTVCLIILPILGLKPTIQDSVIAAVVSGVINLLFANYTNKKQN